MDDFIRSLKRKYKRKLLQRKEKWPPLKGEKFVNLQLVEFEENDSFGFARQRKEKWPPLEGEFVKLQLAGFEENDSFSSAKKDEKAFKTKPISFSELLIEKDDTGSSKVLSKAVVKGNAGMGKTTLCAMLTEQWADDKILNQFKCVLLLPLREREVAEAKSLADLFKLFHSDEETCEAALKETKKREGEDILFIADGWDELSAANRSEDSFLYKLLFGHNILPCASVLVTSRPSALPPVGELSAVDQLVEVIGFKDKELHEYIELNFENDPDSGKALIKELEEKARIKTLCLTPLNCAIICYLWRLTKQIPQTHTKLYSLICRSKMHRELIKRCPELKITNLENFDSLPQPFNDYFWDTCKLAFDALCDNRIVFREEELPQSVFDSFLCFGLIQSSHSLLPTGYSTTYQFVHLAMQEFLAALHFSTFSSTEKISFLEKLNKNTESQFMVMLNFVLGLTTKSENSSQRIIECDKDVIDIFVTEFLSLGLDNGYFLTCIFESIYNESLIQHVVSKIVSGYYATDLRAFHGLCMALTYLATSSYRFVMLIVNCKIFIRDCFLHDKNLDKFADALVNCEISFPALHLIRNSLTTDSLSYLLTKAGSSLTKLKELGLDNNCITYISEPMCCVMTNLSDLGLDDNPLRETGFLSLTAAIESNRLPALKKLSLANTLTEDADVNGALLTLIFEAIGSNCLIKEIDISQNNLGGPGICAVREAFYCLHSGTKGSICILIDSDALLTLCHLESQHDSVRSCNTEYTISISERGTKVRSADLLDAVTILNSTQLPIVGLKAWHSIDAFHKEVPNEVCPRRVGFSTGYFGSIKLLDLGFNDFSGDKAIVLAQCMQACHKSLVELNTRSCSLTLTDVEKIISFLISSDAKCEQLEKWYLSYNTTVIEDIPQISKQLREFSPFVHQVAESPLIKSDSRKGAELNKFFAFNLKKKILISKAVKMTGRASASRDWMIIRPEEDWLLEWFNGLWSDLLSLFADHLHKRNNPDHDYIALPNALLYPRPSNNSLSIVTESPVQETVSQSESAEESSYVLEQMNAEQTDPSSTKHAQLITDESVNAACEVDKVITDKVITDLITGVTTESQFSHSLDRNTSSAPVREGIEITQHTLDKELEELTEPKHFGIKLNIPQHQLEIIERNHRNDIIGQKIALFGFIAKNYMSLRISWSSIADALAEMDHKDLASHIRQTHCQNPHSG